MPETKDLLRALQQVDKRAERVADDQAVLDTYVDSGALVNALITPDNGLIAGRRGTGKTHALRYVAELQRQGGDFVVYIDMDKDLGSTEGIYGDPALPLSERATRLLVDVLALIHDRLLEAAFNLGDDGLIRTLEAMLDHFGEVLVAEQVEEEWEGSVERDTSSSTEARATISLTPSVSLGANDSDERRTAEAQRSRAVGVRRHRVHFGAVGDLMQEALSRYPADRCWLLLDEWSGLPQDIQPYLAEMLRRIFFGVPKVTTRLAIIPHRTNMRVLTDRGGYIGLEVGAEIFPLLDLDEFVVFPARNREEQAERAAEFFRALLTRHLNRILVEDDKATVTPEQMMGLLFTQVTAFQEMIRAAEGVPRDALIIVARAALRSGDHSISTDHIRAAASQVYQASKATALNGVPLGRELLDAIVNEVISGKKARAFLLAQDQAEHPLIRQLIDDRILHLIKRGYSSKDDPGTRFDVIQIDYGCYVQMLRTQSAPQGIFGDDGPTEDMVLAALYSDVEVPEDDYRAIRRAVLDLPTVMARMAE